MVLFIELLLVRSAVQVVIHIQAACDEDVTLRCPGINGTADFRSVTWYKLNNQDPVGIIRKTGSETQRYNFPRTASFREEYSLFLPRLTPEDSGTYQCAIGANVGGKNYNYETNLTVSDCVTQAFLTAVTDKPNATNATSTCSSSVKELPVMWSIIGYLGIALAKIVLSLISTGVVRAIHIKSSRRKQQRWQR